MMRLINVKINLAVLASVLILLAAPLKAAVIEKYSEFDFLTSKNILEQVVLMEESIDSLQNWIKGEITDEQARAETSAYLDKIKKLNTDLKKLKVRADFSELLEKLSAGSDGIVNLANFIADKAQTTNLDSIESLQGLMNFFREYSNNYYVIQKEMAIAAFEFQKKWDFSRESVVVQEYYRWNNQINEIILQEMDLFNGIDDLIFRVVNKPESINTLQLAGKNLQAKAEKLQKRLNKIVPASSVEDLNKKYCAYFSDFVEMMKDLNKFLEKPDSTNLEGIETRAQILSQKSLDYNRACIDFMEKKFVKR